MMENTSNNNNDNDSCFDDEDNFKLSINFHETYQIYSPFIEDVQPHVQQVVHPCHPYPLQRRYQSFPAIQVTTIIQNSR